MKMLKIPLSLLLCALLLVCSLQLTAFADDTSGPCGEGVSWSFDASTGKLTVSGTGAMYDYDQPSNTPWGGYIDNDIKSIEIGEGVTTVGDHAFQGCHQLKSVSFPQSLTSIGAYSFHADTNYLTLAEVTIPKNVSFVGKGAFYNNDALKKLVIEESDVDLKFEPLAFEDSDAIEKIVFPKRVSALGAHSFHHCDKLSVVKIYNDNIDLCYRAKTGLRERTMFIQSAFCASENIKRFYGFGHTYHEASSENGLERYVTIYNDFYNDGSMVENNADNFSTDLQDNTVLDAFSGQGNDTLQELYDEYGQKVNSSYSPNLLTRFIDLNYLYEYLDTDSTTTGFYDAYVNQETETPQIKALYHETYLLDSIPSESRGDGSLQNLTLTENDYKEGKLLGMQIRNDSYTQSGNKAFRFIAIVNNEVLQDAVEYGFAVVKVGTAAEKRDKAKQNFSKIKYENAAANSSSISLQACKETSNLLSGNYGKYSADTYYKFVTFALNNLQEGVVADDPDSSTYSESQENTFVAVRFYIKNKMNRVIYPMYESDNQSDSTELDGTKFVGCTTSYAELKSSLSGGN